MGSHNIQLYVGIVLLIGCDASQLSHESQQPETSFSELDPFQFAIADQPRDRQDPDACFGRLQVELQLELSDEGVLLIREPESVLAELVPVVFESALGTSSDVTNTREFYIMTSEVTQELFCRVMGYNPSRVLGADLPVHNVSYVEAVEFCELLSEPENWNVRLPTKEEWEYCAKAGSTTTYHFGSDPALLDQYDWYFESIFPAEKEPQPVKSKRPNEWGLFDVHGNVSEWCVTPPAFTNGMELRPTLGGHWQSNAAGAAFGPVGHKAIASSSSTIGFRVVAEEDIGRQ